MPAFVVDSAALSRNIEKLRRFTAAQIIAVVKGNGYGLGMVPYARFLTAQGVALLAVSTAAEAAALRDAGITAELLMLSSTALPEEIAALLARDVILTVGSADAARAVSDAAAARGVTARVHVKLDTGMSRLGFLWEAGREEETADEIARLCRLPGLEAEGLFTHFADADGSEAYTMAQFDRFLAARAALEERGIAFKICHCASSAAVLQYPCTYLDMVRPGLVLYGWYPAEELKGLDGPGLEPVMAVKSRVAAVRSLPKGTPVSYGRTAVLERDSRIAVVPVGYGDGYPRSLSNRMVMRVRGVECPIVGRVCMDMCMLDVTGVPGVQAGDVAVVYDGPLLERAARLAGTIPYELMCDVNPRVPRVYLPEDRAEA